MRYIKHVFGSDQVGIWGCKISVWDIPSRYLGYNNQVLKVYSVGVWGLLNRDLKIYQVGI